MTNFFRLNTNRSFPEVYGCDDCGQKVECAFFDSPFPEEDEQTLLCEECYNRAVETSITVVKNRLEEVKNLKKWLKEVIKNG